MNSSLYTCEGEQRSGAEKELRIRSMEAHRMEVEQTVGCLGVEGSSIYLCSNIVHFSFLVYKLSCICS